LGAGLNGRFTGVAVGLVGETGQGFGLSGALVGWRGWLRWTLTLCDLITWPGVVEQEAQPEQSEEDQGIEQKKRSHSQIPSYNDGMRAFYVVFGLMELPAGWRYMTMSLAGGKIRCC
jgi:hypothetical protein